MKTPRHAPVGILLAAIALSAPATSSAGLIVLDEQKPISIDAEATVAVPYIAGIDPQSGAPIIAYTTELRPVPTGSQVAGAQVDGSVAEFDGYRYISWNVTTFIYVEYILPPPPELPELYSYVVRLAYDLEATYSVRFELTSPHEYAAAGADRGLDGRNEDVACLPSITFSQVGGGLLSLDGGFLEPGVYEFAATADQTYGGGIPEWFSARCYNFGSIQLRDLGDNVPETGSTAPLLGIGILVLFGVARWQGSAARRSSS